VDGLLSFTVVNFLVSVVGAPVVGCWLLVSHNYLLFSLIAVSRLLSRSITDVWYCCIVGCRLSLGIGC